METELTVDATSPERNLGESQSRREYCLFSWYFPGDQHSPARAGELESLDGRMFDRMGLDVLHGPVSSFWQGRGDEGIVQPVSIAGGLKNALWSGQGFRGDMLVQKMAADTCDLGSDAHPGTSQNRRSQNMTHPQEKEVQWKAEKQEADQEST